MAGLTCSRFAACSSSRALRFMALSMAKLAARPAMVPLAVSHEGFTSDTVVEEVSGGVCCISDPLKPSKERQREHTVMLKMAR